MINNYVDESGTPIHLPMKFDKEGRGPADESEPGFWGCWCGTNCSWNRAFKLAQGR